ncbi:MAG: transcriptional repressor [Ruminococcaceae bacterium]|nr:transcriptional repressor [Oscillospiraceae bacterium]
MYKHSKQRDMILEYLKGTKSHPTPEHIFDDLRNDHPELGIATVYRNLKMLYSQGLIKKLNLGEGADRYDADTSNHYHFLCESCGSVSDLNDNDLVINFKNENAMKIKSHEVYVFGLCPECNK